MNLGRACALVRVPEGFELILHPGLGAILFPEDGPAPLQDRNGTPTPSRRIVVKVHVA